MTPIAIGKETKNLKPGVSELSSAWVVLHNQKQYLLPVISMGQKFVPDFDENGEITLKVEESNPQLTPLVNAVLSLSSSVRREEVIGGITSTGVFSLTPTSYRDLMTLVRALLLTNYDYTPEDLKAILTCDPQQFGRLFGIIQKHISAR